MEQFFAGNLDLFIKLVVAMFLGAVIGTERIFHGKIAGMRTYAMVSMGSALFVIVSDLLSGRYGNLSGFSPTLIAAQIVAGVGFIGAGLIIFHDNKLMGLTTASGLWVAAGIGMAVGFGLYSVAIFAALLSLFIFSILWALEERLKKAAGIEQTEVVEK